jgi:diaminohydroxyphosphoribosylaminopyrimidine deaminase/5-amino-6-(5-phosphoribosylamino)uracil reductase
VLVGSGTVLADDPRLDVRGTDGVPAEASPRPVVFDGRLRTPPTAQVVRRGALIVTRPDAPADRRRSLTDAGADVVDAPAAGSGARVDLPRALEVLAAHDIGTVLAEPGATLARALLDADLVDRLVLHVALTVGNGHLRWIEDPSPPRWRLDRSGGAGTDLIVHVTRATGATTARSPALEGR